MHCNVKIACLAVACLAVATHAEATKENENVDLASEGFDYHLYARNALEEEAAAIKAEFGDDIDTSLEGYEHELFARNADDAEDTPQSDAEFAKALAEDDEEYDTLPDGVDEAEYEKNAEDNDVPLDRRDAEARIILTPSAAEKKRLGRMKPHYVKHADRVSADLKQFMRRFADDPESGDEDVDVSLEGYDHELVQRDSPEIDDGDNEWEEPQEELKGYDHSQLSDEGGMSPEERANYLKQWNEVVARDFGVLDIDDDDDDDDDEDDDNDRYAAPEDVDDEIVEKRGYTPLQKLRKGVKVLLGYEGEN